MQINVRIKIHKPLTKPTLWLPQLFSSAYKNGETAAIELIGVGTTKVEFPKKR